MNIHRPDDTFIVAQCAEFLLYFVDFYEVHPLKLYFCQLSKFKFINTLFFFFNNENFIVLGTLQL